MCLISSTCTYVSCYCLNVANKRIVFKVINKPCVRGARYMHLISWTLRSGSEHIVNSPDAGTAPLDTGGKLVTDLGRALLDTGTTLSPPYVRTMSTDLVTPSGRAQPNTGTKTDPGTVLP